MARKYSILIVEDEPLIAEDIAGYLVDAGFEIAGVACDVSGALEILEKKLPDAVLLDINLGDGPDGITLASKIRDSWNVPFVFLTSHADKNTLERAKLTLPAGYLMKPFDENDLMTSLEIAIFNHLQKLTNVSPEPTVHRVNEALPVALSQREFDLLMHLQTGKTNKEIAESLFISVNTVKTHLQHLFDKLDVRNRTEAMFRLKDIVG